MIYTFASTRTAYKAPGNISYQPKNMLSVILFNLSNGYDSVAASLTPA